MKIDEGGAFPNSQLKLTVEADDIRKADTVYDGELFQENPQTPGLLDICLSASLPVYSRVIRSHSGKMLSLEQLWAVRSMTRAPQRLNSTISMIPSSNSPFLRDQLRIIRRNKL